MANHKRGQGTKKAQWEVIKSEYITDSSSTYASLAKKYGLSKSTVQLRGKNEEWTKLRQAMTEKAVNDAVDAKLKAIEDANSRHTANSIRLQEIAMAALEEIYNPERRIKRDRKGNIVNDSAGNPYLHPIDTEALSQAARSLKLGTDLERAVLGLPNDIKGLGDPDEGPVVWDILGNANASTKKTNGSAGKSSK